MDCTVEGCVREARSVRSGLCGTHYARLRTSGRLDLKSAEERFWSYVDKGDAATDCWLWNLGVGVDGYARFWVKPRTLYAHRVAYEMLIGPIPDGLTIDHRCGVRHCVNPSHLAPETLAENVRLARSANALKVCCPRGHAFDKVNANGGRECSICRREQTNRHSRKAKTFARLDVPKGLLTIQDLADWMVRQHGGAIEDALRRASQ